MLISANSLISVQGESSQTNQLMILDSAPPDVLQAVNLTDQYWSSNHSLLLNTTAATNDNEPTCDGPRYGINIDAADCLSGLDKFALVRQRLTFAQRGDPRMTQPYYPLPWRWMGSQARCYFQPVLKPGAQSGTTTLYKVRDAAFELTTKCASRQGQGGIVNKLGGDNNVALIMGKYEADDQSVQCGGKLASKNGCRDILLGMPVTEHGEHFGPEVAPGAGVDIPYTIKAPDESCSLKILTTNRHGDSDITSWYKIWEAANAIYYRCTITSNRGTMRGLGVNGELFINVLGP